MPRGGQIWPSIGQGLHPSLETGARESCGSADPLGAPPDVPKSDVIRALFDRAGPIETGEDLIEWVDAMEGRGLGLTQKKS
jgi:hypothetical protein